MLPRRKFLQFLTAFPVLIRRAFAQKADRIYLMPIGGDGTKATPRRPKYFASFDGAGWSMMDYGQEPACVVHAESLSASAQTSIEGNADVFAIPVDLNTAIGGKLTAFQTALDALNIPSQQLTSGQTYMSALRSIGLIFQVMQRFNGVLPGTKVFTGGATGDSKINQLPAGTRTGFSDAITSLGFIQPNAATTVRVALKDLADQFKPSFPVAVGNKKL